MKKSQFGRILVVDDATANLQLLTNLLTEHGYAVYPASDGELALKFIRLTLPDLILLDIRLPGIDGYEVCRRVKAEARTRSVPIIFISVLENESDKVKGFKAGAVDYITKPFQSEEVLARVRNHLHLRELTEHLERKVTERTEELHAANVQLQCELAERRQVETVLRQRETLLNATQRMAKIGGWDWDVERQTGFWTEETYRIHALTPQPLAPGSSEPFDRSLACYDPVDRSAVLAAFQRCAQKGDGYDLELPFTSIDGRRKWIRTTATAVRENGRIVKVVGTIMDITDRKHAEDELRKSEYYKTIQNRIANIFLTATDEAMYGEVLAVVLQAMKSEFGMFGFIGANGDLIVPSMRGEIWDECQMHQKTFVFAPDKWGSSLWGRCVREKRTFRSDGPFRTPEGHIKIDHFLTVPIIFGNATIGLLSVANNESRYTEEDGSLLESITGYISPILNARLQRDRQEQGRKRAEAEREKMQAQFVQAQKLESVGRLAGGVAHDFNNMLGIIMAHAELAMKAVDPNEPMGKHLRRILSAAERSANLTRQLLAFARKQAISPIVLNLNETVESMLKILRRLIGEDIGIAWLPGAGLWTVKLDPSQNDQILANLCVNARDAIAGVGKITIETKNVTFDGNDMDNQTKMVAGEYVMLSISDDGCGMDRETLENIFEPFFTTKEMGKGTGLGLAMVYGIVRQNSGFINVDSEPAQGTTFRIYLPRHIAEREEMQPEISAAPTAVGNETILLVEDESEILDVVKIMLEGCGYRVLAAATPGEALRVIRDQANEIHLLITDVVMPEMTGQDLAKKLMLLYPELKCLFMSGYTGDIIAHHGVLGEGVNFIQKPFSMQVLAVKVRNVLDNQ